MKRVEIIKRFQKCLRRATAASTPSEAEAAEAAARRLLELHAIDPLKVTNNSLYDHTDFSDNALLLQLRAEHRAVYEAKKHKNKKRRNRRKAVILTRDNHETFRLLFNQGLKSGAISKKTGFHSDTVNSARAYLKRSGKWLLDENGHWQWREPVAESYDDNTAWTAARAVS